MAGAMYLLNTLFTYVRSTWNRQRDILRALTRLEKIMASAAQQLNDLKAQLADTTSDILAKLDQLEAAQGDLNPDAQAVLDEIKSAVQDLDDRVGDADGSDQPEPTERLF